MVQLSLTDLPSPVTYVFRPASMQRGCDGLQLGSIFLQHDWIFLQILRPLVTSIRDASLYIRLCLDKRI